MKIVFLDRKSIGEDIDLKKFETFGEVVMYDFSSNDEIPQRVSDADVVVLNKAQVNEATMGTAAHLQLVCVTATGTNNLDKEYLAKRGIAWRNVAGYSTDSVAQHTFAMLFYLYEHLAYYDAYVKNEKYIGDRMFTHFDQVFHELSQKTWGIIGLGNIGHKVAQIAEAFGCNVQYYSTSGQNNDAHYQRVDLDTLLSTSDVLSIHAPLNDDTFHLLDKTAFHKMKPSAILLNVGRGPIIVEQDLAEALEQGVIAGAGVDVLDREPMSPDNPLRQIKDSDKLLITPHIAWASVEARTRLMDIIYQQIQEFVAEQK
jgi:glycerate dehydrogenase